MTARACDDAGVTLGVIRIRPPLGGGGDTGPKMFWRKRHSGDQRRTSSTRNFALSLLTITHHLRSQSHSARKETFRTLLQVHRQPTPCVFHSRELPLSPPEVLYCKHCYVCLRNIVQYLLDGLTSKRARRTLCPERFRIVDVSGGSFRAKVPDGCLHSDLSESNL